MSGGRCWEAVTSRTAALPVVYFGTFGHHHVDFSLGSCTMHHDDRDCEGILGYLTRPTLQVVARGELIPLRI